MTDPIADMLTRIRNAQAVKKPEVILPFSKMKYAVAKILEKEGWVQKSEKVKNDFDKIKIELKYNEEKEPAIRSLKRISKPGRRVYAKSNELPHVLGNLGVAVISTSRGVMTNKEARKKKLGGEVLCEIY
jgi:small subunit ribosomal protein S8